MALSNIMEFEATLSQVLVKLDKELYTRGDPPKLKKVRRDLDKISGFSREPEKLKEMKDTLEACCDIIRVEIPKDEKLRDEMWDLSDYIEFNC